MEKNVIINNNCFDTLKQLPDNSVDLIFADPPYNMLTSKVNLIRADGNKFKGCDDHWDKFKSNQSYIQFTEEWIKECYRILKKDGSFWVIGDFHCIFNIGYIMRQVGFWIINDIIWQKANPTPNFLGTKVKNSHETLIWATKSSKSKYTFNYKTAKELNRENVTDEEFNKGIRKQLGSIWKIPVCSGNERLKDDEGNKLHNTQKPLQLLNTIIAISSKKDDLILDPFGGTMTTAVSAKYLDRNFIMIEKDIKYCRYGQKRIDSFNKKADPNIINATYDIRPLKVTLKEMIENNFLIINESIYTKTGSNQAKLLANGKMLLDDKEIDIHSGASIMYSKPNIRLNGFDCLYVKRNEKLICLAEIRNQYRDFIQKDKNND